MKKLLVFLALLLFCLKSFSQTYEFDYVLEYRYERRDSVSNKVFKSANYQFINSKDNSYNFIVWEAKDKIQMRLDLKSGKYYNASIAREDFFVQAISLKCPYTSIIDQSKQLQVKDYIFVNKADTLINTVVFKHFVVQPVNKKKIKHNAIGTGYYIIDNSLNFNLPLIVPYDLSFKLWANGEKIPNGIIKEWHLEDSNGKTVEKFNLITCMPIKKIIMIDRNCK